MYQRYGTSPPHKGTPTAPHEVGCGVKWVHDDPLKVRSGEMGGEHESRTGETWRAATCYRRTEVPLLIGCCRQGHDRLVHASDGPTTVHAAHPGCGQQGQGTARSHPYPQE